jgi:hypothetical protein
VFRSDVSASSLSCVPGPLGGSRTRAWMERVRIPPRRSLVVAALPKMAIVVTGGVATLQHAPVSLGCQDLLTGRVAGRRDRQPDFRRGMQLICTIQN